ncbi:unnamed protein product [Gulo gulo]|uniref:Uncharacterized protein n=1 Tax=Gulo gulo TaxID=48420 RepID=A0A9X9LKA4_GULGU|nr:unnamed protein product [Gulo gulo]
MLQRLQLRVWRLGASAPLRGESRNCTPRRLRRRLYRPRLVTGLPQPPPDTCPARRSSKWLYSPKAPRCGPGPGPGWSDLAAGTPGLPTGG